MKKVFALLLSLCALALVLSACTEEEPPHEHTYDSTWLYDETQHWHASTCEHTDLESERGDHVDEDNNDICDVCGYIKDHTHSFEEKWTWDTSTHFHKSACGHNVKQDEAAHTDENNDAVCDVCTYDYDHTHTFDEGWISVGESGHWHAPSCGHTVDGTDLTAHADENNDGDCDVCGENGGHEHTFSESYTHTEDEHWREVTCGHSIAVADKGVHIDENGDTTCDTCGYTPPHFHTFADTLTSDKNTHWYASTCGHDVKKEEAAHNGFENDGVCDACTHVVFHLYTVTVHVPEYVTVFAPDGTATASFVVKENTPISFTLSVPDYAEIVNIIGAKQDGKPSPDGNSNVYTLTMNGITADAEVTVVGNKLSAVEMIVADGKGSLNIVGAFKYAYEDITFTAPSAGRYMIFSTSHDELQFGLGEMGENGYPIYTQVYYMDVTEPGEVSLQSRYFPWDVPKDGKLDYVYVVAKIDSEITLGSLKADGYTLPTNADVTVHFTAPKAGKYQISSSTLGLAWNDYIQDSIVLTATEDNQKMSFTVRYENTTVPYYTFDCNIVSMEATPLEVGDNTVTAPYGSYFAISVTAPQAGGYMIQAMNPYVDFYLWNESTGTMNAQGGTYTKQNMKAGEKLVLYVTVDIYDYEGTEDITDIIRVSYLGYVPTLSNGQYAAQVNAQNSFISEYEASDFVLSAQNGDKISVDGGATWHESIQVSVAEYGSITYMVQSASGASTVKVTIERIAYEFTLNVGTQTQTMVPGAEYLVTLTGTSDSAQYVSYVLSWTDPDVLVSYNGHNLSSGTTISNYNEYYTLIVSYNGTGNADITFTLTDPHNSGSTSDRENAIALGSNSIDVTVTNNYCAGTLVTFTAPANGTFVLSPVAGENNAEVTLVTDNGTELVDLPYTFTLEAGKTITFLVTTSDVINLTQDVINLQLDRIPTGDRLDSKINGTYNVNFSMTGLYILTFNDGVLTVTDNNNYKLNGDYKYYYTAFDGVVVTTTDGAPCDIEITINAAGDLTFKCAGLLNAQPLIKQ